LKNCRHKGLTRAVASKRPLPVGDRPDSNRYCWCKRSWKEYAYRRKPWHFCRNSSLGPGRIRKHTPFQRDGDINDRGGQRGSSSSKGTPQAEREFCCGDNSLRQELSANDAICPGIDRGFEVFSSTSGPKALRSTWLESRSVFWQVVIMFLRWTFAGAISAVFTIFRPLLEPLIEFYSSTTPMIWVTARWAYSVAPCIPGFIRCQCGPANSRRDSASRQTGNRSLDWCVGERCAP
jgi:hypothetical protein